MYVVFKFPRFCVWLNDFIVNDKSIKCILSLLFWFEFDIEIFDPLLESFKFWISWSLLCDGLCIIVLFMESMNKNGSNESDSDEDKKE